MANFRTKMIISAALSLALAQVVQADLAIHHPAHGLYLEKQAILRLSPIELVWELERLHQNFEDIETYPEISLREYGDTLIYVLEVAGKEVPQSLKSKVRELLDLKKESSGLNELRAGHRLVNQIMQELITLAAQYIAKNASEINQYLSPADMKKVRTTLRKYSDEVSYQLRQGKFKGIPDLIDDLQKLAAEMEPIWEALMLKHGESLQSLAQKRCVKPAVTRNPLAHYARLMKVYNHRIARNKVQ